MVVDWVVLCICVDVVWFVVEYDGCVGECCVVYLVLCFIWIIGCSCMCFVVILVYVYGVVIDLVDCMMVWCVDCEVVVYELVFDEIEFVYDDCIGVVWW